MRCERKRGGRMHAREGADMVVRRLVNSTTTQVAYWGRNWTTLSSQSNRGQKAADGV